jgi:hypothetical protein
MLQPDSIVTISCKSLPRPPSDEQQARQMLIALQQISDFFADWENIPDKTKSCNKCAINVDALFRFAADTAPPP